MRRVFGIVKHATADEREAKGGQNLRADQREDGLRISESGLALQLDFGVEAAKAGEPGGRNAGGRNAGSLFDGIANGLLGLHALLPSGIGAPREINVEGKNVVGIEAERRVG